MFRLVQLTVSIYVNLRLNASMGQPDVGASLAPEHVGNAPAHNGDTAHSGKASF